MNAGVMALSLAFLLAQEAGLPGDVTRRTAGGKLTYVVSPSADTAARFHPLILFLHGGDGSPTRHNPKRYAGDPNFPFVVVAPQLPPGKNWVDVDIEALLREVVPAYRVDPARIYLTGYSMGGYGAWAVLAKYPRRFAAAAPIAGGGDPARICVAKDVPVWAFHGDQDQTVPPAESKRMVDALMRCGGDAKLTMYPGVAHPSWIRAYRDSSLYRWFLSHKLRTR